jgi:hypothetical protein
VHGAIVGGNLTPISVYSSPPKFSKVQYRP